MCVWGKIKYLLSSFSSLGQVTMKMTTLSCQLNQGLNFLKCLVENRRFSAAVKPVTTNKGNIEIKHIRGTKK
jgi:hypothetical protein